MVLTQFFALSVFFPVVSCVVDDIPSSSDEKPHVHAQGWHQPCRGVVPDAVDLHRLAFEHQVGALLWLWMGF